MSDQSEQEIDTTNKTQPDIAVADTLEISKRPRRTRKATKFYTPAQSISKKRKRRVKSKKTARNKEPTTTGDKRKAFDVPVEQPKKMKVSEFTGSMRNLNLKGKYDETEHRQKKLSAVMKADLITVRSVHGKKHVQQGRCFSVKYKSFEKCTACLAKQTDVCRFNGIRVFEQKKEDRLIYGPDFISMTDPEPASTYEAEVNDDEVKNFLQKEISHFKVAKFRKIPGRNICQLCDGCQTTIFSGYWMCCVCGREYCLSCHEEWNNVYEFSNETGKCSHKRHHYKEQLVPMYHYKKEEILRLIDQCNQMILDDDDSIDLDDGELSDDESVIESSRAASQRRQRTPRKIRTLNAQVSAADNNIPAQGNDEHNKTDDKNIPAQGHDEHNKIDDKNIPAQGHDEHIKTDDKNIPTQGHDEHNKTDDNNIPAQGHDEHNKTDDNNIPAQGHDEHNKTDDNNILTQGHDEHNKTDDNNILTQGHDEHNRSNKTIYENNISTRIHNEHKKTEYEANEMTEEIFRDLWRKGYPFVIKGVDKLSEDIWKPQYFIEHYGEHECTDWPPKDDFAETFPEHYKDFSNSLPFKEYTTRGGALNLAHRLPLEINRTDLGPKMYNAYGSEEDIGGKGTTNLHLDITDAVNLMEYAPIVEKRLENERDKPAAAVWDLYHSAELPRIRRFLRKIAKERGLSICHPIHDQFFYLDKELRERLTAEEGVTGWRVLQNPGDAVFIPAGCAHQVCNYTSCVKAAVDFVSPEGVARSYIVSQQFRKLRNGHKRRMDILQLPNILYHAWSTSWDESND
ncbi:17144_t:CDS:2 [Funneliformis geosporum]|uniref:17144_t:CDS:1 n=1 Tax=Funneliformis geosporum TaxID=1117311 RepID=A0A9W4SN06_9GLOM|nr:17144_t:CDS:2 [Funneliformis geosporum]